MITLLAVVVVFGLVTLAALLSASETSLLGSSRPKIHVRLKKGDKRAQVVEKLQEPHVLDGIIGTIVMGNTLLHIVVSTLVTAASVALFGEVGVVYATAGLSIFILLYAEVMPKMFAVRYPEATALRLAAFVQIFMTVLRPLSRFIQWLGRGAWRLIGVDLKASITQEENEDNLRGAIDLHRGHEPQVAEERRMLKSILELDDITVEEILIHRKDVVAVDINLPSPEFVEILLSNPYTRYPVWENNPENIIGIVHVRDVLKALQKHKASQAKSFGIRSLVMEPWFIPESATLLHQLQAFRDRRAHMALVIDEYGAFQGIITLEDILEEIVGEITDEHDPVHSGVTLLHDGTLDVRGHTTIRDLNRQFDWDLPDQDATTLAGLILFFARHIPKVGEEIVYDKFKFIILDRHRNQLTRVKIIPPGKVLS